MSGCFSQQVLEGVRLLMLQRERVANPDFYPMLRGLGFNNLPDQSTMGAITFSGVVVSHEPFSNGLLFHELIYVEQYRQLGVPRFSELYVRGFLSGGSYEAIPLEVNAYTLEGALNRIRLGSSPWLRSRVGRTFRRCLMNCAPFLGRRSRGKWLSQFPDKGATYRSH
jgi:hypothetical protein